MTDDETTTTQTDDQTTAATDNLGPRPRKTRSDKGKKREQSYMATVSDPENSNTLLCLGTGKTAQAAIDEAAQSADIGQEVSVWKRVGKPRVAQMRLL